MFNGKIHEEKASKETFEIFFLFFSFDTIQAKAIPGTASTYVHYTKCVLPTVLWGVIIPSSFFLHLFLPESLLSLVPLRFELFC
mmetsp:Transcript_20512/g.27001  ORF Transcript_20512/g.27001 Transcript_20512/m.27001 type:complete len:84 (+) Transcript_20512:1719-1970(+)